MSYADQKALFSLIPDAEIADAAQLLWEIRRVKSPREIEVMREVCRINVASYKKGFESIVCGKTTEEELYRIMCAESFLQGAENILPLGIRCGRERYPQGNCPPSNRVIGKEPGEMMLVDGGPCYKGYYSDIIRQAVSGKPTDRQQMMYDIAVEGNLAFAIKCIRQRGLPHCRRSPVGADYNRCGLMATAGLDVLSRRRCRWTRRHPGAGHGHGA
ncbi:MAG: M24 family metallopeptidase [Anaerotruncus colihominis]